VSTDASGHVGDGQPLVGALGVLPQTAITRSTCSPLPAASRGRSGGGSRRERASTAADGPRVRSVVPMRQTSPRSPAGQRSTGAAAAGRQDVGGRHGRDRTAAPGRRTRPARSQGPDGRGGQGLEQTLKQVSAARTRPTTRTRVEH
jgi:hypothetical protein